ncbi:hypothetical protein QWY74_07375 [Halomonas almeriensis]|uniref:hypothetical protein n=1 Tax=Halomonas almeriensis TaxID=308163 RepID=UPI0025B4D030|nr:hypothetical protein [Halomonas almeriensis]MDN3553282.1 hypothetical protein [Halomonas almeriensis]
MSAQDWHSWLEQLEQTQQAVRAASPQEAGKEADRCLLGAQAATRKAAEAIGAACSTDPEGGERRTIRNTLNARINEVPRRDRTKMHAQNVNIWRQHLDSIDEKEEALADALEVLQEARAARQEAESQLSQVQKQQPKASHSALDAIASEIQEAEGEQDRIQNALASMGDDDGAARLAEQEAEEARAKLDDLEASAALGSQDDEGQKAASTALARARKKAEQARQDAQRQESAQRGLERRLAEVSDRVDSLQKVHDAVAERVYMADLEKAERRLMDILQGAELQDALASINGIREKLTPVMDGSFGRAELEVKMPVFYALADANRWSQEKIELQ